MINTPTVLYRCYDAAGALLYIGTTENIKKRLKMHEGQSFWAADVAHTTCEQYEGGYAARAAERQAIAKERPLYNVMCNAPDARYVIPDGAIDIIVEQMRIGASFGRAAIKARIQASVAQRIAKKMGLKFVDGRDLWRQRNAATGLPMDQIGRME